MAESAGILFQIKGDASDAIRAFNQVDREANTLNTTTSALSSSFASLAAPAAVAGAAIAAIGVAAIAGTRAIYDMTKSAAEFGSTIFDAAQKTGLSAQTLSALKFAAEQSGSSFEQVTKGIVTFQVELGKMGQNNEKAAEKMKLLGVTSGDTRTALAQAVKTIYEASDANERAALAAAAFGKKLGPELIPLIIDAKGNLDAVEQSAKALGTTITDEAMVAADRFGDQLGLLNAQFEGIGRTIGNEFMPMFLNMANSLSTFLTENQETFRRWATNASDVIRGVSMTMNELDRQSKESTGSSAAAWAGWSMKMFAYLDPVQYALIRTIDKMRELGAASRSVAGFAMGQIGPALDGGGGGGGGGGARRGGGGGNSAEQEAKKAAREAEQLASRDLAAQIRIEAANLKTVQEQLSDAFKDIKNDLLGSDVKAVQAELVKFTQSWVSKLLDALKHLESLENAALKADATVHERAALLQTQEDRRHKLKLKFAEEIKKTGDELFKEQLARGASLADQAQRYFDADMERMEKRQAIIDAMPHGIDGITGAIPILNPLEGEETGPFDGWLNSWEQFFTRVTEEAPTLSLTLESIAGTMQNAFVGMANAIGSVVQQWVLYGNTGPAVMRKVLAAALASIAAEAAVKAIYAAAWGFILLAQGDFVGSGNAFASAALFAAVAGAAALAGRAVAGNAFKQQTGQATGQSTGSMLRLRRSI